MSNENEGTGTPIVDTVLGDPFRVPGDVGSWLRGIERRARALCVATGTALGEGNPTTAMKQAHARLIELVADEQNSILRRSLRRPLVQLVEGAPARRTLEHLFDDRFRRAEQALAIHADVMALSAELMAVRSRFAGQMPSITEEHLRQARLGPDVLSRVRSREDTAGTRLRVARVEQILSDYEKELYPTRSAELVVGKVISREGITVEELRAAFALRMRVRRSVRGMRRVRAELRAVSARHINELEAQVLRLSGRPSAQGASAAVIEQLIDQALSRSGESALSTSGTPVLQGALAALHNSLHPREDRFAWRPPAGLIRRLGGGRLGDEAASDAHAAVLNVLPVGGMYVCLTANESSVVRAHSRVVRVDGIVECQVVVENGTVENSDLADIDLGPLFDGVDTRSSAWYRTVRRARVKVLAEADGRWYGVIEQAGTVARLDEPASKATVPSPGAFRILRGPSLELLATSSCGGLAAPLVSPSGSVVHFLGAETVHVHTGFSGAETAWLRYSQVPADRGRNAVWREFKILRALSSVALPSGAMAPPGSAAEPVAAARLARQRSGWPVYAIPFGLRTDDSPTLEDWVRSSTPAAQSVLSGVARILSVAHEAGFALGSCDLRMFTYAAQWGRFDQPPVPVPTLVTAPASAPFDERFKPIVSCDLAERYPHLGMSILLPPVRDGVPATRSTDAWGFAAFMLDLLALRPLSEPPATWEDVWRRAAGCANDEFRMPSLVQELGIAMLRSNGSRHVLVLIQGIARSAEWRSKDAIALLCT